MAFRRKQEMAVLALERQMSIKWTFRKFLLAKSYPTRSLTIMLETRGVLRPGGGVTLLQQQLNDSRWPVRFLKPANSERSNAHIDLEIVAKCTEWSDLQEEIQANLTDAVSTAVMKRHMTKIHPLPRSLSRLTMTFTNIIIPYEVQFDLLWGILYLNLKASKVGLLNGLAAKYITVVLRIIRKTN
jgi:hypothetical protein